jgi:hypothetical protein
MTRLYADRVKFDESQTWVASGRASVVSMFVCQEPGVIWRQVSFTPTETVSHRTAALSNSIQPVHAATWMLCSESQITFYWFKKILTADQRSFRRDMSPLDSGQRQASGLYD